MERCKRILLKTTLRGLTAIFVSAEKEKQKSGEREIIRRETG